ncbi:serine hydrolase [Streptomyces goshikiensis]
MARFRPLRGHGYRRASLPAAAALLIAALCTGTAPPEAAAVPVRQDTFDAAPVAFAHPPTFAPGAKWQYSNTNLVLLGLLIEKVSGQHLGEYLQEYVPAHGRRVTGRSPWWGRRSDRRPSAPAEVPAGSPMPAT